MYTRIPSRQLSLRTAAAAGRADRGADARGHQLPAAKAPGPAASGSPAVPALAVPSIAGSHRRTRAGKEPGGRWASPLPGGAIPGAGSTDPAAAHRHRPPHPRLLFPQLCSWLLIRLRNRSPAEGCTQRKSLKSPFFFLNLPHSKQTLLYVLQFPPAAPAGFGNSTLGRDLRCLRGWDAGRGNARSWERISVIPAEGAGIHPGETTHQQHRQKPRKRSRAAGNNSKAHASPQRPTPPAVWDQELDSVGSQHGLGWKGPPEII